jgi:hypothetical protein
VKTITEGQLRQNLTAMLDEVEAGEVYRITRHDVPRPPSHPHPMLLRTWPDESAMPELDMRVVRAATATGDADANGPNRS